MTENCDVAEDVAGAWLISRSNVVFVQSAMELWLPLLGVPYTKVVEDGEELTPSPDFLVTFNTGFQRWVEVKSTPRINERQLLGYQRLAGEQPWRKFYITFVINQRTAEHLWKLYPTPIDALKLGCYHDDWETRTYGGNGAYFDVDQSCFVGGYEMIWNPDGE